MMSWKRSPLRWSPTFAFFRRQANLGQQNCCEQRNPPRLAPLLTRKVGPEWWSEPLPSRLFHPSPRWHNAHSARRNYCVRILTGLIFLVARAIQDRKAASDVPAQVGYRIEQDEVRRTRRITTSNETKSRREYVFSNRGNHHFLHPTQARYAGFSDIGNPIDNRPPAGRALKTSTIAYPV